MILLDFICFERNIEKNSAELAVGMDSGQKRMLVTLTVEDNSNETSVDKIKTFKDTSPKNVIILAHVDDIPENYENVSIILTKLNIQNLYQEYQLVADLKLYNIILGLTTCRPVNYIWKGLQKRHDMEPFETLHRLVKSDRQKREFQGPEIKKLL